MIKRNKMEKVLIPMRFYNLNTNTVEEYYVNIVADVNYIQRFDLQNIKEVPEQAFEIYADVYDKDNNLNVDDIIFLSYGDKTNIIEVLWMIDDMRTPEINAYREQSDKELIRFIRNNKLIEKVYMERKKREAMDKASADDLLQSEH